MSSVLTRQEDERSVLESIFNEDELRATDQPSTGQFFAHIEVPSDFKIVTKLAGGDSLTLPTIIHLPPIVLHYSLPNDYPLNPDSPPAFTLACEWLTREHLSKLCKMLDRLWMENLPDDSQGTEILYIWAQFLKNDSFSFLDFSNNTLDISAIENYYLMRSGYSGTPSKQRAISRDLDYRAMLDFGTSNSLQEFLIEYNEKMVKAKFLSQFHICNICFQSKLGSNCTEFLPCNHVFCSECTSSYFTVTITDGKVKNITCPSGKCDTEASYNQIKRLISPDLFEKYDAMLLEATLNTMGDIIRCPRLECQYSVSRDGEEKLAYCFRCRYAFCVDCLKGYHGVEPCRFKSAEEERLITEYTEGTEEQRSVLEKRYSKKRLEILVQNSLTKAWINDNSKTCPHCHAAIQKSFGCNKMVCRKCDTHFCWICGTRLDPRYPYLHFTISTSKCYKLLFQGTDIDEAENYVDPEHLEDDGEEDEDEDEEDFHNEFRLRNDIAHIEANLPV